jgi:hypothetical protein
MVQDLSSSKESSWLLPNLPPVQAEPSPQLPGPSHGFPNFFRGPFGVGMRPTRPALPLPFGLHPPGPFGRFPRPGMPHVGHRRQSIFGIY